MLLLVLEFSWIECVTVQFFDSGMVGYCLSLDVLALEPKHTHRDPKTNSLHSEKLIEECRRAAEALRVCAWNKTFDLVTL